MSDRTAEQHVEALRARAHAGRTVAFKTDFYALPQPAQDALYGIAAELEYAADALARLAADTERLREALRHIEATARWYADNDQRLQHEVDHALCVEVLNYAQDALASPPADKEQIALRVYCGHHTRVSLVSDGDQGECGWATTVTFSAEEWAEGLAPTVVCGSCGAILGRDDMSPTDTEHDENCWIACPHPEPPADTERLREALLARADSDGRCENYPEVPCSEVADELEWPDDWCWFCYTQKIARAALASPPADTEQP